MKKKPLIPDDDLLGIKEKLERANECIRNLNSEIDIFLKKPEGGFSQYGEEAFHKFSEYARQRQRIPKRLGILTGEIAHHLRSILDHVAWSISDESFRNAHEAQVAFPVHKKKPGNKDELRGYERKIEGIKSKRARKLIEKLQPYNAADPLDDPLLILHNLDRVDKHQTILLVENKWESTVTIPLRIFKWTIIGRPDIDPELFAPIPTDKVKAELAIYIAFTEFGQRKNQPVIPSLTQLSDFVRNVVTEFAEL